MATSAQAILKKLQAQVYAPCYFLQGEEPYYIDAITHYMAHQVIAPATREWNLTQWYGKSASMAAVLTQARRFPIDGPRQVVIVKEAQEMADLKKETGQRLLLCYLQRPQPTTCLVFAYKGKSIDLRTQFGKALAKEAMLVTSAPMGATSLPKFIQEQAAHFQWQITQEATWLIQEYLGNHPTAIAKEFEKLALILPAGGSLTDQVVQTHLARHKTFHPFDFQRAVMEKNYPQSYDMVRQTWLHAKDPPTFMVFALLYRLFTQLLILHETQEQNPSRAAQQIGVPIYFIQDYLQARRQYSLQASLQNITHLHQADLQCKGVGSLLPAYQVMKELIFKLMHPIH